VNLVVKQTSQILVEEEVKKQLPEFIKRVLKDDYELKHEVEKIASEHLKEIKEEIFKDIIIQHALQTATSIGESVTKEELTKRLEEKINATFDFLVSTITDLRERVRILETRLEVRVS
jgi:hypothetical protein